MPAAFLLTEPAAAVVACVAVVAAATYACSADRAAAPRARAGRPSDKEVSSSPRRLAGLWTVLAVSLAALGLSALLASAETASAHGLLLLLGVAAAAVLSVQVYRRQRASLSSGGAAVCALARVVAWLVVLLMIGQPRWQWVVTRWEKPLLTVLIDQSRSMSIADRDSPSGQSRAELVDQATAAARPWIERLDGLYETRTFGIGEDATPLDRWQVLPEAPVSAIATALRRVGQTRSAHGEPPTATLLICDGAENLVDPRVVREAAAELASQRTALLAVGVGPGSGVGAAVVLDALVVPERIGSRDRLRVPVVAHVTGCEGQELQIIVLWGDATADERRVRVERPAERVSTAFELHPPGPGLHRLTARATLSDELGGGSFETSIVVDVRDELIQVLILSEQPRNEFGFAARALRGDPRFEAVQRLLLDGGAGQAGDAPSDAPRWLDYDVVVLGNVSTKRLGHAAFRTLADAVRERGVGLLLAGGRDFFQPGRSRPAVLQDISPVGFVSARPPRGYQPQFLPTAAGRGHPVLQGIGTGAAAVTDATQPSGPWQQLPRLGGAARFGRPKPLATILASDAEGRPLLAAVDVGRGRSLAAAWDSTWPWALSSEAGLVVHRKLWRQMAAWLANRRPVAWVVTDRSRYTLAALQGGQQRVAIRAGLSGVAGPAGETDGGPLNAHLALRRLPTVTDIQIEAVGQPPGKVVVSQPTTTGAEQRWAIPLERDGDEWRAELPQTLPAQAWCGAGDYELVFVVEQAETAQSREPGSSAAVTDTDRSDLTARTGFEVIATDLEMQEPTANLALLREAAARTEAVGGGYYPINALPAVVRDLAETDQRRRIDRRASYDLIGRQPWLLLVLVVAALGLEWVVRKRGGMP